MISRFKEHILRDKKWLAKVKTLPCVLTGHEGGSDPAHIRDGLGGGMALKPGDDYVLPLRPDLHREQHQIGERPFWRKHVFDREAFVMELLGTYACAEGLPRPLPTTIYQLRERLSHDDDFMMACLKGRARELYRRFKNGRLDLPF
jgi:hypothetical protein